LRYIVTLTLTLFIFCAVNTNAITFGGHVDSGAENGASVSSVTTGVFSLTAGQLVVCVARSATPTTYDYLTDVAGNVWARQGQLSQTTNRLGDIWYSFTQTGNASETVTLNLLPNDTGASLNCGYWSKTASSWNVDYTITATGNTTAWANSSSNGSTLTSKTFSDSSATELLVCAGVSASGQTFTAGTIGGTAAAGSWTNGTNGTTADQMTEYLIPTSLQAGITCGETIGASNSWNMAVAGFYESSLGTNSTFYIRNDGGPRSRCTGKTDAADTGSGTNQPCGFGDFRYLYSDGTSNGSWAISGGDTVIVRGGPWRIGATSNTGTAFNGYQSGNPFGMSNPTIPPGTSAQHTRILGENYANCTTKTQLHGGYALFDTLNLEGAQFVDVHCLELTDYAQCNRIGSPAFPGICSSSSPYDDYATMGFETDVNTHDVLMQDLNIHGFADYGIFGPIGGLITMTRDRVAFNAFSGWIFDDGFATPDASGSNIIANQVTMEWNGCDEEYPIVDANPAISCYDDVSSGFGDAWSAQGSGAGGQQSQLAMTCNQCILRYNTKDGFGMNHIVFTSLSITNSLAYGNMGQQWKWDTSPNANVTFENNLTVGNCRRMHDSITGAPSTFNTNLSDFCRAAGDLNAVGLASGVTITAANSTTVGYAATMWDFSCIGTCTTASFTFRNMLSLGYANTNYNSGTAPGLFFFGTGTSSSNVTRDHNDFFGVRNTGCPTTGFTGEVCTDPLLVNEPPQTWISESQLDVFNSSTGDWELTSGSPAKYAGVSIGGLTTDYNGFPWNTTISPFTPSMGALEFGSSFQIPGATSVHGGATIMGGRSVHQ
jgi:hypothetical protein